MRRYLNATRYYTLIFLGAMGHTFLAPFRATFTRDVWFTLGVDPKAMVLLLTIIVVIPALLAIGAVTISYSLPYLLAFYMSLAIFFGFGIESLLLLLLGTKAYMPLGEIDSNGIQWKARSKRSTQHHKPEYWWLFNNRQVILEDHREAATTPFNPYTWYSPTSITSQRVYGKLNPWEMVILYSYNSGKMLPVALGMLAIVILGLAFIGYVQVQSFTAPPPVT